MNFEDLKIGDLVQGDISFSCGNFQIIDMKRNPDGIFQFFWNVKYREKWRENRQAWAFLVVGNVPGCKVVKILVNTKFKKLNHITLDQYISGCEFLHFDGKKFNTTSHMFLGYESIKIISSLDQVCSKCFNFCRQSCSTKWKDDLTIS